MILYTTLRQQIESPYKGLFLFAFETYPRIEDLNIDAISNKHDTNEDIFR